MKKYFEKGQKLKFSDNTIEYEIKDIVGTGSSCAVYLAEGSDGTEHLLKEYNPKHLDVVRDYNGNLFVDSEEDEEAFEIGLKRFRAGYIKQLDIRKWTELRNVTSNVQGIYSAYGTDYIGMTFFSGVTFDKVKFSNLYELVRYIRTITRVVGNYHDKGFLHLDIKPENIFTIPETPDLVMLFDFDSVTEKSSIRAGTTLSYTQSWAAPEQIIPGKSRFICEATDIFAIGEMLFYGIYNRHSLPEERRSYYEYKFDGSNELLEGLDKPAAKLLSEILKHTISNSVSNRYQNSEQLIIKLDKLSPLINPDRPKLVSTLPSAQSFFVGRDGELLKIEEKLSENNKLFVTGIGGIGKTELVKNYAVKNKENYSRIMYAVCSDSLINAFVDDSMISISNFVRQPDENIEDYLNRKMNKLNELLTGEELIVFDNFDSFNDPLLSQILSLNCFVIFTTRKKLDDFGYSALNIEKIEDRKNIDEIFYKYYTKKLSDEDAQIVEKIINLVDGHTMTVELLAKQCKNSRIRPEDLFKRMERNGILHNSEEKVSSAKDDNNRQDTIDNIIKRIFELSNLNSEELAIMKNMFFIPTDGIKSDVFKEWTGSCNYEVINSLIDDGWIKDNDGFALHPIIQELLKDDVRKKPEDYANMFNKVIASIKDKDDNYSYSMQVAQNATMLIMKYRIKNDTAFNLALYTIKSIKRFYAPAGDKGLVGVSTIAGAIAGASAIAGTGAIAGASAIAGTGAIAGIGALSLLGPIVLPAVIAITWRKTNKKLKEDLFPTEERLAQIEKYCKSIISSENDIDFVFSISKYFDEILKESENKNDQELVKISESLLNVKKEYEKNLAELYSEKKNFDKMLKKPQNQNNENLISVNSDLKKAIRIIEKYYKKAL